VVRENVLCERSVNRYLYYHDCVDLVVGQKRVSYEVGET